MFIDVDDFKTVNDSLGHAVGDQLLVAIARRLEACLRPGDTTARLGGDEFGVLLEDMTREMATAVADRILGDLHEPFQIGRNQLFVRASIGIALHQRRRETGSDLLRNADVAMYSAKARHKGGYEVFEPGMERAAVRRLQLSAELERAVLRGEFSLRYQPLVALETGEIRGAEALVRWEHPNRGVVLPAEFVGLAEESGLIRPLGRWVLDEACTQAKAWQPSGMHGRPVTMSVNLSARQLADPALATDVADCLAQAGLDPALLTLEITESVLMQDTDFTLETLARLKELGIRIAIDDFGTGYSSFSYLRRFPIDGLKIDRSFVAALQDGGDELALVRSIIDLSRTLRLETVAEGVENRMQAEALRGMGGDLGQGYYFSRPLMSADFAAALGEMTPLPMVLPGSLDIPA